MATHKHRKKKLRKVAKPPGEFSKDEWFFGGIPDKQLEACWEYEFARESAWLRAMHEVDRIEVEIDRLECKRDGRKFDAEKQRKFGHSDAFGNWYCAGLRRIPKGFPHLPFKHAIARARWPKPQALTPDMVAWINKLTRVVPLIAPMKKPGAAKGALNLRKFRDDLTGLGAMRLRRQLQREKKGRISLQLLLDKIADRKGYQFKTLAGLHKSIKAAEQSLRDFELALHTHHRPKQVIRRTS